jgi:hypothetical protein
VPFFIMDAYYESVPRMRIAVRKCGAVSVVDLGKRWRRAFAEGVAEPRKAYRNLHNSGATSCVADSCCAASGVQLPGNASIGRRGNAVETYSLAGVVGDDICEMVATLPVGELKCERCRNTLLKVLMLRLSGNSFCGTKGTANGTFIRTLALTHQGKAAH